MILSAFSKSEVKIAISFLDRGFLQGPQQGLVLFQTLHDAPSHLIDDLEYARISDLVPYFETVLFALYEFCFSQDRQMVRDIGLLACDIGNDLTDAAWTCAQFFQDLQAHRMGKGIERRCLNIQYFIFHNI